MRPRMPITVSLAKRVAFLPLITSKVNVVHSSKEDRFVKGSIYPYNVIIISCSSYYILYLFWYCT